MAGVRPRQRSRTSAPHSAPGAHQADIAGPYDAAAITSERTTMKAADVMTSDLVTVLPDAPVRTIAQLLLKHGISAVPVVDTQGAPLGIVSEGDLMPRNQAARETRRDWWLQILSEGGEVHPDYLRFLKSDQRTAKDVMVAPLVTVGETADLSEVADLLVERRIKRVPVVRDGRIVGIVSRADVLKSVAGVSHNGARDPVHDDGTAWPRASDRLAALMRHPPATPQAPAARAGELSAAAFRALGTAHELEEEEKRKHAKELADEKQHRQASEMLASHLSDENWQKMLRNARIAANKGEDESLLLRFPAELCSDHGRAVNAPDPEWPLTLRGIAADIFLRWKAELRPHGFTLHARVVDFPGGVPGDIGLFLSWGKSEAASH
jgi:CBS domain-containing protein